jgi:2-polyprenyl-6-methoxyphenol hydroxylase-like FAD-dependent oxidoreductase
LAEDHDTTALIIGGGIGGLTAAVALRQYGVDSRVFEQADDIRKTQVGSGLSLGYNVTRAFKHLDLLDELLESATSITGLDFITHKGRRVGSARALELALGILRPALHGVLVNSVGEDEVEVGTKLVRFEQDGGGVTAHFADGRTARGEVLIGADGFQSTVRKQLLGDSEPKYRGYCTRRGILHTELAGEGPERVFLGIGERFVFYPVGQGYLYWTAATNEPPGGKEDGAEIKRQVLERYRDWPGPITSLVEATDESKTFLSDTYDRDPVDRWGDGRVTLLGDAAHPMTWDRGQGASQAIEGAVLLGKQLGQGGDPVAGLRAWEAERIPRTKKMVRSSRAIGRLQQSRNPLLRFIHHQAIRIETRPAFFEKANKNLLVEYGPRPAGARRTV